MNNVTLRRALQVHEMMDAVSAMPRIEELDADTVKQLDGFIAVLGFEERCLAISDALSTAGCHAAQVALCTYRTNIDDNRRNDATLRASLASIGPEPEELDADGPGYASELRCFLQGVCSKCQGPARIAFDISTASNEVIVRTMRVLLDFQIDLTILYAEADQYHPTSDEYQAEKARFLTSETMGLEQGVLDVFVSTEYPGQHASQLPHQVIVFPGFSKDRVRAAISKIDSEFVVEYERAPLIWMIGRPHLDEDAWRRDAMVEIHSVTDNHEQHEVSTFDYREAIRSLEAVYGRIGIDYNLSIAPLGSKLQALGVAIFCFARPDVRVILSQPKEYNAPKYSRGAKALWRLCFEDVQAVAAGLNNVDTLNLVNL